MKKVKAIITNDFKSPRKIKQFNASIFIAKYNRTERSEENYKIFIDRDDDRRIVLKLTPIEASELLDELNKFLN